MFLNVHRLQVFPFSFEVEDTDEKNKSTCLSYLSLKQKVNKFFSPFQGHSVFSLVRLCLVLFFYRDNMMGMGGAAVSSLLPLFGSNSYHIYSIG